MIEDDSLDEEKKGYSAARALLAPVATLVAGLAGFYMFAKDWSYFESGQSGLIACFIAGLVGLFFSLARNKMALAVLAALLCAGTIVASQKKYEWRRDYLEKSRAGTPFVFEPYIVHYPPYEEYLLAPWMGTPDWVRFARACADPVQSGDTPAKACSDLAAIRQTYHIDAMGAVNTYRLKMAQTAQKIADGKITKKIDYLNCLSSKQCAEVPLLPPEVDADMIDPGSDDYLQIRRPFWQLINDKSITPEICGYISLCRILDKTGALEQSQQAAAPASPRK